MKLIALLFLLSMGATSCITPKSRVVPAKNIIVNTQTKSDKSLGNPTFPVTIFLLERDIPSVINRLGVVRIVADRNYLNVDSTVKQELQRRCKELGANGAYRLSEGYYPGNRPEIHYLVFKYE
ncbi:hypothetical protein [Spirosoma linguale]|uniref:hypothetical protein n=1 Tax=Spirosoma linguale TaxID=108 RepID=UPI003CC7DC26